MSLLYLQREWVLYSVVASLWVSVALDLQKTLTQGVDLLGFLLKLFELKCTLNGLLASKI